MPLGADLSGIIERYYANYNKLTHTWRIIDLQHPEALKIKSFDEEIPDTHPAVTIIPELMFAKLIIEAQKIGLIGSLSSGHSIEDESEYAEKIVALESEVKELKDRNSKLSEEGKGTESFRLKNKIIDVLAKTIVTEDISSIK